MTLELLNQIIFKYFETDKFVQENVSKQGLAEVYLITIKNINYILRMTTHPYSIPNNIYALKQLENKNVAPKIITNGRIKNYEYSIETFLSGIIKSKLNQNDLIKLIEKITHVHSIKSSKCGFLNTLGKSWNTFFKKQMILVFEKDFKKNCSDSSKYLDYVLQNIPKVKNFSMLHGDLNENNVLFIKNEAFLFDFEGCYYGDREYDIANLNFRIDLTSEDLNLFVRKGYSGKKILYYTICVLIRKIAKSPHDMLEYKINKLERTYEELQIF